MAIVFFTTVFCIGCQIGLIGLTILPGWEHEKFADKSDLYKVQRMAQFWFCPLIFTLGTQLFIFYQMCSYYLCLKEQKALKDRMFFGLS